MIAALLLAALGPCASPEACTAKLRGPPELVAAARGALARLTLVESEPKSPPQKLEPKVLRGDVSFSIELEPAAGGEIIVRALSLHRPVSVYGLTRVKPQALPKPKDRARALELAMKRGIEQAMEDLAAQLAEAAGQGKRTLKLSVRVNALGSDARKHVAEQFIPCLKGQFDQLGAVTEPREIAGYLEDVVEYAPVKDEPRDALQWQANRLRELSNGAKAKCLPPPKYLAKFRPDSVNRGIIVELE